MTAPRPLASVAFSKRMADRHLQVVKDLGYVLTLNDTPSWLTFSITLRAKLTEAERAGLAYAALMAMDHTSRGETINLALPPEGAGPPLPVLCDPTEDAVWWSRLATPEELRAYCLAAFMEMPRAQQRDFLAYVGRRAA